MKKLLPFVLFILFLILLCGCTKNASEIATDASLHHVAVIERQIKEKCPTGDFNASIATLKASIQTQLATCKAEKAELKQKNNTLLAVLIGLIAVIVALNWIKIKTRIFK